MARLAWGNPSRTLAVAALAEAKGIDLLPSNCVRSRARYEDKRLVSTSVLYLMKPHLLWLALTLAGCATSQAPRAQLTPGVNFSAYKTYNFMDVKARTEGTTPTYITGVPEIKQAVTQELERRGYRQSNTPDLWVNIGVVTQNKVQTRETNIRDAPRYIGQRNYHWQSEQVVVNRYSEGTASIELVDAARNERVWEGTLTSIISPNSDKRAKRIDKATAELFAQYPVPAQQ